MRRLALVLGFAVVTSAAAANPLDMLRGSIMDGVGSPSADWGGYYIGGQAGTGSSDMNFTGATDDIIARLLDGTAMENEARVSQWPLMSKASTKGSGWGGFVGYNAQWSQAVIGIEASYLKGDFGGTQTGSMSRVFGTSNGYTNDVTSVSTATMAIHDMASVRLRLGYAFGNFMPYAFGGVALGLADIARTARVYGTQVNLAAPPGFQNIPFDVSETSVQNNHLIYGYAAGLGIDMLIAGNIFLRGEWEFVQFASSINTTVNTVRGGVGMKF